MNETECPDPDCGQEDMTMVGKMGCAWNLYYCAGCDRFYRFQEVEIVPVDGDAFIPLGEEGP